MQDPSTSPSATQPAESLADVALRQALSRPREPGEPLLAYQVGRASVVPLVQFHYRVDPLRFFPDLAAWPVEPDAWYWQPPFVVDQMLAIDMGGFLLRTAEYTVLVDAGIGNGKDRPNPHFNHRKDDWLSLLARCGIGVNDVDALIFTHLHVDHVGFATTWDGSEWTPTFPRARHLVSESELAFWTSATSRKELGRLGDYLADSVLPLERAGLLERTNGCLEVNDEVRLVPAAGHTPGNVCVELRSDDIRALFVGDMVHHPVQLAFPGWSTDYCIDYGGAADARRSMLESLGEDDWLFAAHFPDSAPGHIRPVGEGGYRFERANATEKLT